MNNQDAFIQFDQDNPKVWDLFVEIVLKHINAGHRKGSVEFIFNIMRWQHDMETTDPFYKINNNHKPFYARKWRKCCADSTNPKWVALQNYFQTRESQADDLWG